METESLRDLADRADRELLRAFVDRADGAAFAALVTRHGPLVLGACRRILADARDAEDAFQATFLILARKAGSVRAPERLGSWLYGVALRCAHQARKATRRPREQPMFDLPAPPPPDPAWADVGRVLDAEIGRLPDKLRTALVLCELQGLDRATAAERLGVPVGTVSSRLSRAKDTLRRRLVRRGITLSLAALDLVLAHSAGAAVPPPLAATTVAGALRFKSGAADAARPAALANRVLRARFLRAVGVAVAVGLVVLGSVGVSAWAGREILLARAPDDRAKIQGEWTLVSFKFHEVETPEAAGQRARIDAGRITFDMELGYTLDPSKSPKAIDVLLPLGDGPGEWCQGVYELTDDRLTLVLAAPGDPRPAGPDDPGRAAVIVFERVRK